MRRRRTNIDKQENLVKALWDFAAAQQNFGDDQRIITDSKGTCVLDPAIRKAICTIMDNFGYDVLEVQ